MVDANTVLNSVTVLGVAFLGYLSVRHGRGIQDTKNAAEAAHDAVKTRNGTTLGELASDDEDRRLIIEAGEPPTEGPLT